MKHDGLYLSEQDSPAEPSQEWLDDVATYIFEETGFKLELSCKPFDVPDVLREYSPVMNDSDFIDKGKVQAAVPDTPQLPLSNASSGPASWDGVAVASFNILPDPENPGSWLGWYEVLKKYNKKLILS